MRITGILLLIFSAMSLGTANIFYKTSNANIGPVNTTFFYYLFGTLFALIIWGIWGERGRLSLSGMVHPMLIAVFLVTSVLCFNLAIKMIPIASASTVRSLSFVFTALLAVLFLGKTLTIKQIIGIGMGIGAVFLLSSGKSG